MRSATSITEVSIIIVSIYLFIIVVVVISVIIICTAEFNSMHGIHTVSLLASLLLGYLHGRLSTLCLKKGPQHYQL